MPNILFLSLNPKNKNTNPKKIKKIKILKIKIKNNIIIYTNNTTNGNHLQ